MPRDTLPPRFKPWSAPPANATPARTRMPKYRGSPRSRGYDADWDEISISHRRRFPFCRFCAQIGRDTLAAVVDHILPAREFPELRRDRKNHQSLCSECHDRTKQRMEAYARKARCLEKLVDWCEDPWSRPIVLQPPFPKPDGWQSTAYQQMIS